MGVVKKEIIELNIGEIKGIDRMFGRQMKFDAGNVPERYRKVYDKTRKDIFDTMKISAVVASYEIETVTDDSVRLKNGAVLESTMLARAFRRSTELVFYVVGAAGYEDLDEAEENMAAKLFLDAWGTAVIDCASEQLKRNISKELEKQGIYSTFAFNPGQHNVSMEIQKVIFGLLAPEEIGVTLNEHYLMHPKKSVSGIFGIGPDRDEERLRPCDFCELRENCSSAYSGDVIEED